MARKFKEIISPKELEEKINWVFDNYRGRHYRFKRCKDLTTRIKKDLSKCDFDTENVDIVYGPDSLMGYQQLGNGLSFLGLIGGGDWEVAVFFIIYWDGKQLRGYIPSKGNFWNTDTHRPYGNGTEKLEDFKNLERMYPNLFEDGGVFHDMLHQWNATAVEESIECFLHWDPEKIIEDIANRIQYEQ